VLTPTPVVVVDGRRFAMAYFAELQKTPGFQVVPVGVTETAILENELDMGNSEDRRKLAELLDVDAVVVGAITDYNPYHPRMGLHVAWYSPRERTFRPGSPTEPLKRRLQLRSLRMEGKAHAQDLKAIRQAKAEAKRQEKPQEKAEAVLIQEHDVRGQSPDGNSEIRHSVFLSTGERTPILQPALYTADPSQRTYVRPVEGNSFTPPLGSNQQILPQQPPSSPQIPMPLPTPGTMAGPNAGSAIASVPTSSEWAFQEPVMSYTRYFDGTNAELQATLRDYVELSGERRGGGWRAHLDRSEDFIRFTSHLMIVEMFTLHGGEGKRRYVWKFRKYK